MNDQNSNSEPMDTDLLDESGSTPNRNPVDRPDPPVDEPVDLLGQNQGHEMGAYEGGHDKDNLEEVQAGYVDSPFADEEDYDNGSGINEGSGLENVQAGYVDSPFDDQEEEDMDQVTDQYVDNPFDDNSEERSFLGESNEEPDGIFEEQDGIFRDDPNDEPVPGSDGAAPPKRRRIRRLRPRVKTDTAARRRRRRRLVWACICCCLILLLVIMIIGFIIGFGEDSADPAGDDGFDDDENIDDDWTTYKPFDGITTTPMDPFDITDCDFSDNRFPHVKAQCRCHEEITIIPDDVAALKEEVHSEVNREIYDGKYFPDPSSCDPANQALVWLASGDTRDSGDFFQRYVLAMSHLSLNGTHWDDYNDWMAESNECFWLGIACNSRFQVHNFASDANNLHGKFPTELTKLNGLRALSLSRNHLTGTIPTEVFGMRNLEHLHLFANQMRGKIPPEVGNSKLKSLLLGNNLFFGTLVTELGRVTTLQEFGVGFNEFWRKVPTEMGLLTDLRWLVMEENRFSGRLPTEFGKMSHLEYWLMSNNLMHGSVPMELANLSHLREWRLSNTGLGGTFPTEFGPVMTNLFRLEMGSNNFVGPIMTEFGYMSELSWLALNDNDLTGTIPTEFGLLNNMTRLTLQDTLVSGKIPTELGQLQKLRDLNLDKTSLTGEAPDEVCNLRDAANLKIFVTDCEARGNVGVACKVPQCCSFCRRGESANN